MSGLMDGRAEEEYCRDAADDGPVCDNCGEPIEGEPTAIVVNGATILEPPDEAVLCDRCADGPDEPEWSNHDPEPPAGWEP